MNLHVEELTPVYQSIKSRKLGTMRFGFEPQSNTYSPCDFNSQIPYLSYLPQRVIVHSFMKCLLRGWDYCVSDLQTIKFSDNCYHTVLIISWHLFITASYFCSFLLNCKGFFFTIVHFLFNKESASLYNKLKLCYTPKPQVDPHKVQLWPWSSAAKSHLTPPLLPVTSESLKPSFRTRRCLTLTYLSFSPCSSPNFNFFWPNELKTPHSCKCPMFSCQ